MLFVEAPTALRTPISCVRSATETSMMFMTPMPPTTREIPATIERMPEMIEKSAPAGWVMSLPERTVKFVSPDLDEMRVSRIKFTVSSRPSVFWARMLICWIWRELSILFRAEAETKRQESRSRLLKFIGSSIFERMPTMMKC